MKNGLSRWLSSERICQQCRRHKRYRLDPWVRKIWRRAWQPIQYSCQENPMDKGAWWPTSPQGHKKSDTAEVTEHAHTVRNSFLTRDNSLNTQILSLKILSSIEINMSCKCWKMIERPMANYTFQRQLFVETKNTGARMKMSREEMRCEKR